MDKASASGAGDSRFESWAGHMVGYSWPTCAHETNHRAARPHLHNADQNAKQPPPRAQHARKLTPTSARDNPSQAQRLDHADTEQSKTQKHTGACAFLTAMAIDQVRLPAAPEDCAPPSTRYCNFFWLLGLAA